MSYKGLSILMKGKLIRVVVVLIIFSIFSLPNLSILVTTVTTSNSFESSNVENSNKINRLLSQQFSKRNISQNGLHNKSFQVESLFQKNQVLDEGNLSDTSNPSLFHIPSMKISGQDDVVIEEISPEAMEINATSMIFELNFTITGSEGNPSSTLQNLKISNATETFKITTWSDWTIFVGTDKYSLIFILNNSVLSRIYLGWYNFTITTEVLGYSSSNSIPLPMKDLIIDVVRVEKSEFNNKLDGNQSFNITIQVWEDDGTDQNEVYYLSGYPNTTLFSVISAGVSGPLHFVRFLKLGEIFPYGEFIFEVNLTASVAKNPAFDDAIHTLVVSVASLEGIIDNDTIDFESQGTVLLVKIDEISIGTNPPFDYNLRTNNGSKHTEFRINVNDSIMIKFHLWDNSSQEKLMETRSIIYQDPNNPGDPFAIRSNDTNALGIGNIVLTADVYTPIVEGYTLLLYVQGHKSSQEEKPSNVTIYWDLLEFDFSYYDRQSSEDEYGSFGNDMEISRGINIGDWWVLDLSVSYITDHSPAYSAQISYRFSNEAWTNKTDGADDDSLDGLFTINRTSFIDTTILFECRVVNGSIFDPQGNYFVNNTYGPASFSFNVTWTYLVIEMIPRETDRRLNTREPTEIDFSAFWAHDSSNFTGTLNVIDDETKARKPIVMTNGVGTWSSLYKTNVGNFNFSVLTVNDPLYDITKFTNQVDNEPDEKNVQVAIIWDVVYFVISDMYNSSIILSLENSTTSSQFYANYGESQTLYCYGRHSYDNKPFIGNATLIDRDSGEEHPFVFDEYGIGQWSLDRTDARRWVEFKILFIESEPDYNITRAFRSNSNSVKIIWDKVRITLEASQSYSHGTWANISVSLSYEVNTEAIIDPSDAEYSLHFNNESIYENVSWTYFLDYSFRPAAHWYNVTSLVDYKTGLTGFDVFFNWTDDESSSEMGNLAIYWIDDEDPKIIELQLIDLGNGTILVIVDVTDEDESWEGSGIGAVKLFDNRETVQETFPISGTSYVLSEEYIIHRYVFRYTFNQTIEGWGKYFQFDFGETLVFNINVVDRGTPSNFPGHFEPPPPRNITSEVITLTANFDSFVPEFIKGNKSLIDVYYITMENSNDLTSITVGDVSITTLVQDDRWSGLNTDSAQLNITNVVTLESNVHSMTLNRDLGEGRSVYEFRWVGNLPVGEIYTLTVIVTDNAGNNNIIAKEEESIDYVAPRIHSFDPKINSFDRKIEVTIILEEAGLGVEYVTIELTTGNITKQFNLTLQGGIGSGLSAEVQRVTYSGNQAIDFDFTDIIQTKTYSIKVLVSDKVGNSMVYGKDELERINDGLEIVNFDPLIFHPVVLIFGAIMLITGIVIGIRITSKVEGYDMKRIFDESERISREEVLTQMDEFALGVTVNFFDQVQGPVPVIWEPPLLEDQEQVMLDLSDKSFSTLEFVGLEETERSGTFDFSTGSYECTALGYSFSIANPQARGGKENLTIVLLLRKEWGDHLLVFQDELLEKIREIRQMIVTQDSPSNVQSNARILREFVSRLMISFNKIYISTEDDSESKVE